MCEREWEMIIYERVWTIGMKRYLNKNKIFVGSSKIGQFLRSSLIL